MTLDGLKKVGWITFAVIMIGSISYIFVFMILMIMDSTTLKQIGTERVKCIDEKNNEFEDEWCKEEVHCSWLGIIGDIKCKRGWEMTTEKYPKRHKELKEEKKKNKECHLICKNCGTDYELSPLIKAIKEKRNAEVKKAMINFENELRNNHFIMTEELLMEFKKELGLEDEEENE